jgi:hypothetical protein
MPIQIATMAALVVSAFLAVPQLYANRFNGAAFWSGIALFCVLPPLAGSFQSKPARPIALFGGFMLLLCPLVYLVTDGMHSRAEVSRDSYFLATFSIVGLLSGAWLRSSLGVRRWASAALASVFTIAASFGAFVLIALVLYLE